MDFNFFASKSTSHLILFSSINFSASPQMNPALLYLGAATCFFGTWTVSTFHITIFSCKFQFKNSTSFCQSFYLPCLKQSLSLYPYLIPSFLSHNMVFNSFTEIIVIWDVIYYSCFYLKQRVNDNMTFLTHLLMTQKK